MICPKCKNEFVVEDKNYKCPSCQISLPVTFYGYELKQDDIDKLVIEERSNEIEFYSQAKKKKFKAKLVYKNGKVDFEFCSNKENEKKIEEEREKENDTVCIFLNSLSSGVVRVFKIDGEKEEKIYDFGTKATRYSHALSLIAILPLVPNDKKLRIISDDLAFVKYALGEATPRDRDIRTGIYVLLQELKNYTWSLELSMKKLKKLKGGNSKKLSNNLFPYINVTKSEQQGRIIVEIENCNLAVEEHFLEYMQKAVKLKLGKYIVPKELEEKLELWQKATLSY